MVEQGLTSLAATRFALEVEARLGVPVPVSALGSGLTLDALVGKLVGEGAGAGPVPARSGPAAMHASGTPAELALLPLQQAYLVTSDPAYTADPAGCHIYREYEVRDVPVDAVISAWSGLVARHEILRAGVGEHGALRISQSLALEVQRVSASEHDVVVAARRARMHARIDRPAGGLVAAALVASPGRVTLHLSLDGLVIDGHGLALLVEQWLALAREPGRTWPEPSLGVAACVERLSRPHAQADLEYWREVLARAPAGPFADHVRATLQARPEVEASRPVARRALTARLTAAEWQRCTHRAREQGISPSALVFAAFAEVVLEAHGERHASFVLTTSERPRLPADARWLIGPFTSSMVVPVGSVPGESVDELAGRLHQETWRHLQHGAVPAVVALRSAGAASAVSKGLPVVFTSLLGLDVDGRAALRPSFAASQTSGVALDHQMWEDDGELVIHWDVADQLLPPFTADICLRRLESRLSAVGAGRRPGPALNPLQQAYFVSRVTAGADAPAQGCSGTFSVVLDDVDVRAVSDAWREVAASHAALRSMVEIGGEVRVLDAGVRPSIGVTHVGEQDLEEQRVLLDEALARLPHAPGRWAPHHVHLLVGANGAGALHLSFDLLMLDGKSIHQVVALMLRTLAGVRETPAPAPTTPPSPPVAETAACRSYWAAKMASLCDGPPVRRGAASGRTWRRLEVRIAGFRGYLEACRAGAVAPDAILAAALAHAFLPEVEREFALPVVWWRPEDDALRPAEMSQMAWVALAPDGRAGDAGAPNLAATARALARTIASDLAHGGIAGLSHLGPRILRSRGAAGGPPLSLPVVYTSLVDWGTLPDRQAATLRWRTMTPDISLDCVSLAVGDTLVAAWDVVEEDFAKGVVARSFARYATHVERALRDPAWALGEASGDAEAERRKVIYDWNDTRRAFPAEGPVHLAFERAAAAHAGECAVRWRGGAWTFAQLDRAANRIARRLRELGIGPEEPVAIAIRRGPEMVAAVLGILKAGGAYVPIEPSQPERRAHRMLQIAGCKVLLTCSKTELWTLPDALVRVAVDELPADERDARGLDVVNGVDSTAYIIFTSGSTGEPKGVAVAHRALHNLFHWCQRTYGFGPGDVGLCVTSLGFDLSVFDLLGLLGYGAGIYVADAEEQRDPSLLAECLVSQPITFWNSAPITLDHLRPYFADLAGRPEAQRLRLVFLSGDYTPLALPPELFATFPRARLISLGGATEATVWSNFFEVSEIDPSWRSIPYGRPIDNARYYILDAERRPCPVGVEGDLYIAGEVLSLGYYRRPELTAERFVPDPFVREPDARMYYTGDRARFFPDGVIAFQGRLDTQVKIRGFRVELQEIEHALRQHPSVADAVVIARADASGDPKLVAYLLGGAAIDPQEVARFASSRLPPYMVPNFVHAMERFPATSNGKLDRGALPWPLPEPRSAGATAPSATSLEELVEELRGAFARFLGRQIDPDADIWSQGVTSFTMVQIGGALRASRGVRLPIAALVEKPTVREMARSVLARLEAGSPAPASAPPAEPRGVDFLDGEAKRAFLASGANRRLDLGDAPRVTLSLPHVPPEWFAWRGSQRSFDGAAIPLERLASLLGLLAPVSLEGRTRFLFPSAGDTYSVQTYLWVRADRVDRLAAGFYWFDGAARALVRVGSATALDRSLQFFYNRPAFDAAAGCLFLVGERRGIEPLYREEARRFLLLEAGYMGQLLMLGQRDAGLGLCPIGMLDGRPVHAALGLGETQELLHSFLIGGVVHEAGRAGVPPPLPLRGTGEPARPAAVVPEGRVAIVAHSGRYAGADGPEALWRLLRAGESALRPAPRRRGLEGAGAHLIGGFLDDIDAFDPLTFSIAPSEARNIDPQARLLLEVVWECLERAGHTPASLQQGGERVGVFVGHLWQDYGHVGAEQPDDEPAVIAATGSELANRISHAFGFTGPSIAVDTACASTLTALHLASSAVVRGECDSAIVCGVNLVAHPYHARVLRGLRLVAERVPEGAYDQDTAGWALGEGAGALLLRRTTARGAGGDTALALVEATHVEHAGGRTPFGAPSSQAIRSGLRAVLAASGLAPGEIDYVECAASGAPLSDAAEWQALAETFPAGIQVGTLKPNIGHLEAGSGLSQVSKVLLQLEHGELAPTRLAPRVSALINPDAGPVRIVTSVTPLGAGRPRRMLVNAVGATGSSAQVILASPPRVAAVAPARGPAILLLSAASRAQLDDLAARYATALAALEAEWLDVCATTQLGRASRRCRLAVEVTGAEEAIRALRGYLAGRDMPAARWTSADPALAEVASQAADERRAVHDWLAGYQVDWTRFWTGEPRRVPLPGSRFVRQRSWASAGASPRRADETRRWVELVRGAYARAAEIPPSELDERVALERYGLSSRIAAQVVAELNRGLGGARLPATLLYEHRDLLSVAAAVSAAAVSAAAVSAAAVSAAADRSTSEMASVLDPPPAEIVSSAPAPAASFGPGPGRPVAIIGLAGRYPGAPDVDSLWRRLVAGEDLVTGPPADRLGGRGSELLCGGFLPDVAAFDPFLFGITPDDAALMDPQERIFLEVVWEALEDACHPPARLKRELSGAVGVFAGVMHNEYPLLGLDLSTPERPIDAGATPAGVANRISYHLDLGGPSLTIDTMCSSSLTALHLAVEALRAGRVRLAIVGATNLSLHANKFVQQARLQMTSSDHRCRSFGAGGDGFVPGEGAGAIVLRLLDDAERAGDRIHGVIRGTAVNHGGKVNGFTVPNPRAQAAVIAAALSDAGVAPETVSYVEAHGTGTALGDPIEARALISALALRAGGDKLAIGSIKSNIGHLEAAAGLAGVTKVLLQLRHRTLAPSLHSSEPNPDVDWTCLQIPQLPEPWRPRRDAGRDVWRAGVSSFGAGGTNAHVVLEAYPEPARPATAGTVAQVLVLSAATADALTMAAGRLADFLDRTGAALDLADVAATLQIGREALKERWAAVCRDRGDAIRQLRTFVAGGAAGHRGRARPGAAPARSGDELASLAARWVVGGEVEWRALHPGPRRMVSLPSYPFTHMRCWIDGVHRGGAEAAARAILAERVWRPAPAGAEADAEDASVPTSLEILCLITPSTEQLGRELVARLGPGRARVVDEATHESFEVPGAGGGVALVVLSDLAPASAPDRWRRPFEVCRALARRCTRVPVHVLQVVSGLHAPSTSGAPSSGALLAGLVHGLAAERRGVTATVLDVGPIDLGDGRSRRACADAIVGELVRRTPGDVCITPLGRLVPTWEALPAVSRAWAPRADALYLVTGGTRGIGATLAAELVRRGARRLALVGRSRSAASETTVRGLREAGAAVEVHHGRLEERAAFDAWLRSVEREQGPVAGIFHCAGVGSVRGGSLLDAAPDDIASVVAPKVDGLAALLPAMERSRPEIVVAFSSISAAVPALGVGVGDYAAANNAMEYTADQYRRRGWPMLRTVAWPVWDSSGASQAARAAMRSAGAPLLSDAEAFSFLWSVAAAPGSGRFAVLGARQLASRSEGSRAEPPRAIAPGPREPSSDRPPPPADRPPGAATDWLAALIAARIGMPVDRLDRSAAFGDLGIGSVMLGRLVEDIEAHLGRPIDPSFLLKHPPVEQLAAALPEPTAVPAVHDRPGEVQAAPRGRDALRPSVAVVGMAVRFPGAPATAELWDLLARGVCAVGDVPADRWDVAALFDPGGRPGTSISRWGGFLDGIEDFDPEWFGMAEDEARCLDPAIRLFLEGAEACFRDAGRRRDELGGARVGVFVGARLGDYRLRIGHASGEVGLGADQNFIAARVAHHFDLRGPNMVVDAACASSLAAVHLACQSLLSGESELALAGGVDVLLDEAVYVQFTAARALSRSGRCRTFDKGADGFVPGEGCGVFLLKRLDDALRDGDRILAVLEGSAVNNDGRTMGLTTPNPQAQKDVVATALARAQRRAREIGLIEAHGTATMIGDPIELGALTEMFRTQTPDRGFCAIGSVKTNLGHLLSAAGAAGLAKVILAVQHGVIPPTLFCDTPNPRFALAASPFFIPRTASTWGASPRLAGVSAFGFGGTNVHVVVGQPPEHTAGRTPLPAAQFRRRRLWLERPSPRAGRTPDETLSLLDLSFVDRGLLTAGSKDAGRLHGRNHP